MVSALNRSCSGLAASPVLVRDTQHLFTELNCSVSVVSSWLRRAESEVNQMGRERRGVQTPALQSKLVSLTPRFSAKADVAVAYLEVSFVQASVTSL